MEKEYYINHVKSRSSLYNKIEELAKIAGLPITVDGLNIKYDSKDMQRERDTYYYKKNSKNIFIFIGFSQVRLACFDTNTAEIYDVDFEHNNTFRCCLYDDGILSEITVNPEHIFVSKSNNLTVNFKELLDEMMVKFNKPSNRKSEYCSLEFSLPKLLMNETRIINPFSYIPESKAVIIDNNQGKSMISSKGVCGITYKEEGFKLEPSLFKSELLTHHAITHEKLDVEKEVMDPTDSENITAFLRPMRHQQIKKTIYEVIFNEHREGLTRYLLRYYDDVIHGLHYFQNEDINKFYVFEEDIKRLQYK